MLELLERLIEQPSLLERPLFEPFRRLFRLALSSDALRDAVEATAETGGRGGEAGAAVAGAGQASFITRRVTRSAAPPGSQTTAISDEAAPESTLCDDADAAADATANAIAAAAAADDDGDADADTDVADSGDDADDVLGRGARSRAAAEHARQVQALVNMPTRPSDAQQIAERFTLRALKAVLQPRHLHGVSKLVGDGPGRARRSLAQANVRANDQQRLLELSKRYVAFFAALHSDDFELATADDPLTVENYMCLPQTTLVSILLRRCLTHLDDDQRARAAVTLRSAQKLSLVQKIVDPELARKYRPYGVASAADGASAHVGLVAASSLGAPVRPLAASSPPTRTEPLTPLFPGRRNSEQQGTIATVKRRTRARTPHEYFNVYAVPQTMLAVLKAVEAAEALGAAAGAQLVLIAKLPAHGKRPARLCVCGSDAIINAQPTLRALLAEVIASASDGPESEDSQWCALDRVVNIGQIAESWTTWANCAGVAKLLRDASTGVPLTKRARHMQSHNAQNANPEGAASLLSSEDDDEDDEHCADQHKLVDSQTMSDEAGHR
jgi:hypothetical protein